mgnify:CR=1 FL=1
MKKIILALVAFMLVLGMTQCKKEQPNNATIDEGETVYISLKVTDDGAKHVVYPYTGAVVYSAGDKIYVGNNGKYVGTLTYANGTFRGSITNPSTSDYLHFYFTGGKTPATAPTAGSTTSFTVNISDQTNKLPVISYGHSATKYVDGNTAYTCMLGNKCGLVKFVPAISTNETISVGGMRTTATIDFATPGITPTDATGAVSLYSVGESEKWAILLPQDEVMNSDVTINNFHSTIESVPEVTANMYYNTGVGVSMTPLFTVNADGKQVYFAKGNLKYTISTNTWSFMEHQYDMVESPSQNVGTTYANADVVSLFGWGTSGYEETHDSWAWQPNCTATNMDVWYIVYGDAQYSLFDQTGKADWGYNAISNGGNTENSGWRTPTKPEWDYVFNTRVTPSGIRYAMAKVNDVNGILLLPDTWATDLYVLNNTNFTYNENPSYDDNVISVDDWTNILEANGAVFLPAAGLRYNTNCQNVGDHGFYWSATAYRYPVTVGNSTQYQANQVHFVRGYIGMEYGSRSYGCSVRLVKDVN